MRNREQRRYDQWVEEATKAMKHAAMVIKDAGPSNRPAAHDLKMDVMKRIKRLVDSRPDQGSGEWHSTPQLDQ